MADEETKTLTVSVKNWQAVNQIKIDENLPSIDEAVTKMVRTYKKAN